MRLERPGIEPGSITLGRIAGKDAGKSMRRAKGFAVASWSDVRRIALGLPGANEGKAFGSAAWTVKGKLFVWERPLRKSDLAALGAKAPKGPVLGVRTADLEMKDVLLASDSKIFFTTPHFDGYPAVLVRLDKIGVRRLRDVIEEAWLSRAGKRAVAEYLRENSR